jgi:hypothetical protein
MQWSACLLLLTVSCGSVSPSQIDARPFDASSIDGAAACDLSTPFGGRSPVGGANTAHNEWSGRLSPDQLILLLGSDMTGGTVTQVDLYVATRAKAQDAFGTPVALASLNTTYQDSGASMTADGLTIYFHSSRPGSVGADDLYTSTRTSTAAAFPAASPVLNVNTAGDEQYPYIMPDGLTLYFQRDADLYVATRGTDGQFATPIALSALNTSADEGTPVVTPDQLTIFFSRSSSATGFDIYVAHRLSTSDGFGTPVAVTELNTDELDIPQWVSPDGCTLYFISRQSGAVRVMDLLVASHM